MSPGRNFETSRPLSRSFVPSRALTLPITGPKSVQVASASSLLFERYRPSARPSNISQRARLKHKPQPDYREPGWPEPLYILGLPYRGEVKCKTEVTGSGNGLTKTNCRRRYKNLFQGDPGLDFGYFHLTRAHFLHLRLFQNGGLNPETPSVNTPMCNLVKSRSAEKTSLELRTSSVLEEVESGDGECTAAILVDEL